jgi:hypothetical protein
MPTSGVTVLIVGDSGQATLTSKRQQSSQRSGQRTTLTATLMSRAWFTPYPSNVAIVLWDTTKLIGVVLSVTLDGILSRDVLWVGGSCAGTCCTFAPSDHWISLEIGCAPNR